MEADVRRGQMFDHCIRHYRSIADRDSRPTRRVVLRLRAALLWCCIIATRVCKVAANDAV